MINGSKEKSKTSVLKLDGESSKQEIEDGFLKMKNVMESAREELPYTYKVLETFEELQEFLQDYDADYQSNIVDSIIKCNHWSPNNTNKEKLSNLFLFLLQHVNDHVIGNDVESIVKGFQIIDRLSSSLYDLAHLNPRNAKSFIQEIINEKHHDSEKNKKNYTGLDTLIFFKLVSLIFPTSDFRHPVTTARAIFMSEILFRCHIKNEIDVSKDLFIPTLISDSYILYRYDGKKHKTVSREKAEREKLLHNNKKEMKGAMREIRRDLTKLQIKQQIKSDGER